MIKSSLKWAGSKQPIIDKVSEIIGKFEFHTLVEPFFGAGNVSLNIDAENYILSDFNRDLVDYHNSVISDPFQLIEISKVLFQKSSEQDYYSLRTAFNQAILPKIERSAIFLYLNKYGFNGLCRYNKKGEFNSPWCRSEKIKNVPEKEILEFSKRFQKTPILCQSFEETIRSTPTGSLIYCDPPYVPLNGTENVGMYANGFGFSEQENLKDLCKESESPCLISNHWTPYTEELYSDADELIVFPVRRSISRDGQGRVPVQEVVAVYRGT